MSAAWSLVSSAWSASNKICELEDKDNMNFNNNSCLVSTLALLVVPPLLAVSIDWAE